ncbi:MAG: hypothetical protein HAW67_07285, partial [Endozoicomonadaceae bacterium]|nr:hypothetical protein [Endozoicomonadaceae bacterium]
MSTTKTLRTEIQEILEGFNSTNYDVASKDLFEFIIGEQLPTLKFDFKYTPKSFINKFKGYFTSLENQKVFEENIEEIEIITQITDKNLRQLEMQGNIIAAELKTDDVSSILLVAVKMKQGSYRKSIFSNITRQINRAMPGPTIVAFNYEKSKSSRYISIAFIDRRPHKKKAAADVIGHKVSMIFDVDCTKSHPAHLDIIIDLHLPKRISNMRPKDINFRIIMDQWLKAFSVEKIGKDFYKDLFEWFQEAEKAKEVTFPECYKKRVMTGKDKIDINEISVSKEEQLIRLITRFMFCWFSKEKGLIPESVFIRDELFHQQKGNTDSSNEKDDSSILKSKYDDEHNDYYCAILQNLFFATLNTPKNDGKHKDIRGFKPHKVYSSWCYEDLIANKGKFKELMNQIPFINGGLFDCLDSSPELRDEGCDYMLDCFTDDKEKRQQLSIPNGLFFSSDEQNKGLIEIFNRYKFTVEENTPLDIEVALDPELLGHVFENLLAAYNKETRKDARKSTGSYYTPKEVVSYMVAKSITRYLVEYIKESKEFSNIKNLEDKINLLLSQDAEIPFDEKQREAIVHAISKMKTLDPAVGSGAFPMEILRFCADILHKIDPENTIWKEYQIDNLKDDEYKKQRVMDIQRDFDEFSPNYFRKLYLIHNNIYGVDIQPIACQIAKLRLFISLVIEQDINSNKDNRGIQPLPNLETNFICANSLFMLPSEVNLSFETSVLEKTQSEIEENRRKIFGVTSRQEKLRLAKIDGELRHKLRSSVYQKYGESLERAASISKKSDQWASDELHTTIERANKISSWDLMDTNVAADWFEPEWMFSIKKGFDIVIGNPPYIKSSNMDKDDRKYITARYLTATHKWDIYIAFFERSHCLLNEDGILCFVTSRGWINQKYGEQFRTLYLSRIHS